MNHVANETDQYFVEFAEALMGEAAAYAQLFMCDSDSEESRAEQYQSGRLSHIVPPSVLERWVVIGV
jgi:hypothetical protein